MIVSEQLIDSFFKAVSEGRIQIYNEFSFQHELGSFLRQIAPKDFRVEFERPTSYFGIEAKLKKTETDIAIYRSPILDREALELKFPRNKRTPETLLAGTAILIKVISDVFADILERSQQGDYAKEAPSTPSPPKRPSSSPSRHIEPLSRIEESPVDLSGMSAAELLIMAEERGAVFSLPGPGRVSIDYLLDCGASPGLVGK